MSNYHDKYNCFYYSKEWRRLRDIKFKAEMGLCEECRAKGIIREGKEIHHILPIDKYWECRLHYDNLVCLCSDCHNAKHERISKLQQFLKEDEDGQKGEDKH